MNSEWLRQLPTALHQEIREQGDRSYLNLSKDEHIVRLHIGLEDPKDLIEDLRRSLKFIKWVQKNLFKIN